MTHVESLPLTQFPFLSRRGPWSPASLFDLLIAGPVRRLFTRFAPLSGGQRRGAAATLLHIADGRVRDRALARAPHPEWGLVHQGAQIRLTRDASCGWLTRRAGPALAAIGAPLGRADLTAMTQTARAERAVPVLYKCDGRTAAIARRAGWSVIRLATEAVISPADWTTDRPACRQLRRKLRQAEGAGVTVAQACHPLPIPAMERVSADWIRCHGTERGFSMGRFDPALLAQQRVILASHDGRLVGFASFHVTRQDWSIDLMRHRFDAPEGTMHLIICAAIAAARDQGCRYLSLAAFPAPPDTVRPLLRRLGWLADSGQFKTAFGPRLMPLYAAGPGPLRLVVALAAVARAIHAPSPDPSGVVNGEHDPRPVHRKHENFRFESGPRPCDAQPFTPPRPARSVPVRLRPMTGCLDDKRPHPPS